MSRELEHLLRTAQKELPSPDDDARRRALERVLATVPRRRRRGWTLLAFTCAIVVASAVGFGFGQRFGPEPVQAARPGGVSGAGFFPSAGWSAFQRGGRSVTANVAIHPDDLARDTLVPVETIRGLPADGTVIVAELVPRVSAEGARLPLRLDAAGVGTTTVAGRAVASQRLRAPVEGHTLDVHVLYGTTAPSRALVEQAQRQLDRLVVAAPRVTIRAELHNQPEISPSSRWVELSGTIASSAAGEIVEVVARDCGPRASNFYRIVGAARTSPGGAWTIASRKDGVQVHGFPTNAYFRARWDGDESEPVLVRVPVFVNAFWWDRKKTVLGVLVNSNDTGQDLTRRFVEIQRKVGATDQWVRVRRARLGRPPKMFDFRNSYWARFPIRTKGLTLRAVVPAESGAPCYRATTSEAVKP